MDIIVAIGTFLVENILQVPAYLVGIMAAIGLVAMRKNIGQVIGGALKAALGFLILGAGAGVVISAIEPLGNLILGATGAQGVVPTNEAIVGIAQEEFGGQVAYVMICGFALSLLLARFTPLKYIFLTGHHVLFMATLLTVVLSTVDVGNEVLIPLGALLLATIMVVMPAFAHPWMKKITGGDDIAIGHFGSLGYIAAGATGQLVGSKSRSTEDLTLPQGLRFLRDPMVATAISMVLIYEVFAIAFLAVEGEAAALEVFGSNTLGAFFMDALMQALLFGVGVAIILFGVRIILGELVPAFQGIAEKVVPGAKPALDAPIVFPYAPNAVLVGFLSSFAAGLVSLGLIALIFDAWWGLALILPGMVPHFFTGGAAGVFGNATGGRLGAVLGGAVNGMLITFLPAFLLKVLGTLGFANTTFGDADFAWFGIVVGNAVRLGPVAGIVLVVVIDLMILALAVVWQRKKVNTGWVPGGNREKDLTDTPTTEEV